MSATEASGASAPRVVEATLNYAVDTGARPRFHHANDHSLDTVVLDPQRVPIVAARGLTEEPTLERQGSALLRMPSAVTDFTRESNPAPGHRIRRTLHHNIWRTLSPPPQDMPLAICDAGRPRWVPHSAFTDPAIAEGTEARASVEVRTIAYWFD